MSNSYRHTPIIGHTTRDSEKLDKKLWHRNFRRAGRQSSGHELSPNIKTHSDPWTMAKDGKVYFREATKKDMRK